MAEFFAPDKGINIGFCYFSEGSVDIDEQWKKCSLNEEVGLSVSSIYSLRASFELLITQINLHCGDVQPKIQPWPLSGRFKSLDLAPPVVTFSVKIRLSFTVHFSLR